MCSKVIPIILYAELIESKNICLRDVMIPGYIYPVPYNKCTGFSKKRACISPPLYPQWKALSYLTLFVMCYDLPYPKYINHERIISIQEAMLYGKNRNPQLYYKYIVDEYLEHTCTFKFINTQLYVHPYFSIFTTAKDNNSIGIGFKDGKFCRENPIFYIKDH